MASKKNTASNSDMTMKVVIVIALAVAFVVGYFVARTKYKPQIKELTKMVADKDSSMQKMKADANKVFMKDDIIWIVEDGLISEMVSDKMLSNGDKATLEGKIIKSDKSEVMMSNGDEVGIDGVMRKNNTTDENDSQEF